MTRPLTRRGPDGVGPLRVRIAALVLRLPLGQRSRWRPGALVTVLRAADDGVPAALRAVPTALTSLGPETVWRTWAEPPVAGPTRRRWTSPLVAELLDGGASRVPDILVDAGWRDWLDDHEDALWSLLKQWNRAATTAAEPRVRFLSRLALDDRAEPEGAVDAQVLAEAAARFDHPVGERARALLPTLGDPAAVDLFCRTALESPRAAAFCVEHRLAPADEVQRAVFFVRTAQGEQLWALDPDGSLLALGYRGAPTRERSALREAMTALGGVDVLRVLAGRGSERDDIASLTEQERAYLVGRFADRGDWDGLWRLLLLLPLVEAVRAVRACGAWRPQGEDEYRVFEALRAADPVTVDRRVNDLAGTPAAPPAPHTRIRLAALDPRLGGVSDLDFAPDGTQLALVGLLNVGTEGDGPFPSGVPVSWAGLVDLGSGTPARLHGDFPLELDRVAHLGADTMVVAEKDSYDAYTNGSLKPRIHYLDGGGTRVLDPDAYAVLGLERIAGDRAFVVTTQDVGDETSFRRPAVFVGGPEGSLVRSGILDGLGDLDDFEPLIAAVDPGRRRVAMVDVLEDGLVADFVGSLVNKLDDGSTTLENVPTATAALSPTALVCCTETGDLKVWHQPLAAKGPTATIPTWSPSTRPDALAWSPVLDRFLAVDLVRHPYVEVLEVPPTHDAPVADDLVSEGMALADDARLAPIARLSPKGDVLAVAGATGLVDLYVLTTLTLRPFIARPMGLMTHQDLEHVTAVWENPLLDEASRTTLALLRTCLRHRFRNDIGIGDVRDVTVVGSDEIELGR